MKAFLSALLALFTLTSLALASPGPDERLDDPALEARALTLYAQLRCVVCQSQSIRDSNAPLAEDMRAVVRERLLAGESDAEVLDYLQARYGDYVLMMPPLQANTLGLWLVPALVFLGGAAGLVIFVLSQHGRGGEDEDDGLDSERARALDEEEGLS
ncbi:cytochrome c-type biogenesis protein [Maricaulis parjimensis]|uniref:cytochrome c-type biogenesis protein n=1 Tax=Maricaulis parjimensis TaxID=144023 RepID=UPI00193A8189|nr:cytochrome c-type biogenesis protein [Maricaulis parjimensis]